VGRVKTDAIRERDERRIRAQREPGWCPLIEAQAARTQAKEAQRREIGWARINHRSWAKDDSRLSRVTPVLGKKKLDEITTADVEHFLALLLEGERAVSPAT
jgi:hypothetical protein